MSIDYATLENSLKKLECRTNFRLKKITEYMLPHCKHAFYLHREGEHGKLVLMPALQPFAADLAAIPGVRAKADFYHNAEMTRFPKRLHTGRSDIHYGLPFEFDNEAAVEAFIGMLCSIVNPSQAPADEEEKAPD